MSSSSPILDYLESVVYGNRPGLRAAAVRGALLGLSMVYRGVIGAYLLPFRAGIRRTYRLRRPVVSVGNLVVGGTGKTPVVRYVSAGLAARGRRPAVLSYGYGGSLRGEPGVVSDGQRVLLSSEVAGDEPAMLASALPGIPVVVSKHRHLSGRVAVDDLGADVLVLDDGFQVWKLARDFDILLVNADSPLDNRRTLPAGRLREPVTAARRADCIIATGARSGDVRGAVESMMRREGVVAPVFTAAYRPVSVISLSDGSEHPVSMLLGRPLLAVSAIANPESFGMTLAQAGMTVVGLEPFIDHHRYTTDDADRLRRRVHESRAEFVITTEKDAVKLGGLDFGAPVFALRIDLVLDDEPGFWGLLANRLGTYPA